MSILFLGKKRKIIYPIIIILIFAIGSLLRLIGDNWGLPYALHPDEPNITAEAVRIADSNSFEPRIYNRPNHISIKINSIVYKFENLLLYPQNTIKQSMNSHMTSFYLASRFLVGLFGILSILLAYLISRRFNKSFGIICAMLFAIFPSFIEHSHYITPDIVVTFFILCDIYFSILYFEEPKFSTVFLMSLFLALATLEKYPGALISIVIAYVIIMRNYNNMKLLLKHGLQFTGMYIGMMFLISPTIFLDYKNVIRTFRSEARTTHLGADGLSPLGNFLFYMNCFMQSGGIILFLFFIVGLIYCIRGGKKYWILPINFAAVSLISVMGLHWERWGVPIYASMLLIAGVGIYDSYTFIKQCKTNNKKCLKLIYYSIISISIFNLICNAINNTAYFVSPDTRIVSMSYVKGNSIATSNTSSEGYSPFNTGEPNSIFNDFRMDNNNKIKPINQEIKYVILSSEMYSRYIAEPQKYKTENEFYRLIKSQAKVKASFYPVNVERSSFEPINIINEIKATVAYQSGGYSGPSIIIYSLAR